MGIHACMYGSYSKHVGAYSSIVDASKCGSIHRRISGKICLCVSVCEDCLGSVLPYIFVLEPFEPGSFSLMLALQALPRSFASQNPNITAGKV